ncbi:hypothetical protein [Roseovarius aestuarii]|nr:hypothetical protein [Roseovarius aestuarii]
MSYKKHHVLGIYAPAPRPTLSAALLLAVALCVPVSVCLTLADMLF